MEFLVLNGSPRPNGNTAAMVEAFVKGAEQNGHYVYFPGFYDHADSVIKTENRF